MLLRFVVRLQLVWHGDGSGLYLSVRRDELLNASETAAAKLARRCVGPRDIGIDHPDQPHIVSFLRKLVIDAGMVAPEGAYANDGNIDRFCGYQVSGPRFQGSNAQRKIRTQLHGWPKITDGTLRLLEQCDLPRVIQLMLRDAAEHEIEVVIVLRLTRNALSQTRIRKRGDCLYQFCMHLPGVFDGLAPRGFAGVCDRREILLRREFGPFA